MSDETKETGEVKDKPDLTEAARNLAEKKGGGEAAIVHLLHEAKANRDEIRDLKRQIPTDGSVVLTGEQVKEWSAYQALGKPDDLRKTVREHPDLAAKVAAFEREKEITGIATIAGFKPSVLQLLADRDKVAFEVKDGKDDKGKPTKTVMVKAGDKEPTPIHDYAESHWADLLPSLKPESSGTAATRARGTPSIDTAGNGAPQRTPPDRQRPEIDPIETQVRTDLAGLF